MVTKQLIKEATRITKDTSSLIDIIAVSNPVNIAQSEVIPCDISDHEIIGFVRKLNRQKYVPRTISCRDFKKYNPAAFRETLSNSDWNTIYEQNDVNSAWLKMKAVLVSAIDKHAPIISKRIKGRVCPWLNEECKVQINLKDRLMRKARKSKKEEDWVMYKNQRNHCNAILRKAKNKHNQNLINECIDQPEKFWSAVKNSYPTKSISRQQSSIFNIDGNNTADNLPIANAFCQHFSTVASKLKAQSIKLKDFIWNNQESATSNITPTRSIFTFRRVTVDEIYRDLRKIKPKKAAGLDNIPPRLLRDAANEISQPLTHIINKSLQSGFFPSEWKIAKITPLFKSGNSSNIDNYRPISILPALSKILEKAVHRQLVDYLESNSLLYKKQFGYRKGKSTEIAVTYFIDTLRTEIDKGNFVGAIFIDLSKAFDTISHSALLKKLPFYGIHDKELDWMKDYLFNRHQTVSYNNTTSDLQPMTCGVPQGSILGPILFLLYFNDFVNVLEHSEVLKYADDTVLFVSHKNFDNVESKLTEDMKLVANWFQRNDLIMNVKKGKTESMLFGTKKRLEQFIS